MDVRLITMAPSGERKVIPVKSEVTTVGRQTDCHLRIPLREISRQHCQILLSGGRISVRDLGSSNGTYVNGEKVSEQSLNPGDVVSLADALKFLVQVDGEPEDVPAAMFGRGDESPDTAKPAAEEPAPSFEPAEPLEATAAGVPGQDEADMILSESFFLDDDEEED